MGKELSVSVASLRAAYPNAELQPATVAIYTSALERFDPQLVHQAVGKLILHNRFIPSIAEIAEAVAEQALRLPSPAEAWNEAEGRAMHTWPYDKHPLVSQALTLIGGLWEIRTTESPSVVRSQFLKLYADLRKERIASYVNGHPVDEPALELEPQLDDRLADLVPELQSMP